MKKEKQLTLKTIITDKLVQRREIMETIKLLIQ